jgi:hypothetical protein
MKRQRPHGLGDFTADWGVVPISLLAVGIGLISTRKKPRCDARDIA